MVLERDGLLQDRVQHMPVGLRGRLAQQQPLELVLVAGIGVGRPAVLAGAREPLGAGGAARGQVGAVQRVQDAGGGQQAGARRGRGRQRLDEALQVCNPRRPGRVAGLLRGESREAGAGMHCRELQPVELAVDAAHVASTQ